MEIYDVNNGTSNTLIVSGGIVIAWILAIVTVFGNSFVILVFITQRSLHSNPANLFILNLSIADFLTGVFSFPLNTLWLMYDYWPFDEAVCKIWLIVDYTACAVSVCCIIFISLDRYWMLKLKMKYRQFQTTKRVTLMILVTWAVCIPFYAIPTLLWTKFTGESGIDYSEECEMESEESLAYNLVVVCVEFLIPLPIIVYLNVVVYREIRARSRTNPRIITSQSITPVIVESSINNFTLSAFSENPRTMLKKHRKAAVTLAALVVVFAICWTPYNIVLLWSIICDDCLSDDLWETVNYLLWCNSAVNPIVYALTNSKIREAFYQFFDVNNCKRDTHIINFK